jgi:hypothetical protein
MSLEKDQIKVTEVPVPVAFVPDISRGLGDTPANVICPRCQANVITMTEVYNGSHAV